MEFIPLDETLINSDTCIRCGSCCKWTTHTHLADDDRLDWLNTMVEDNDKVILKPHNRVEVSEGSMRNPFEFEIKCSKLVIDKKEDTYKCGVYQNRPKVCEEYNCFAFANNLGRRPQNFDRIKNIIKEVHGVDVEWTGPMESDNYKKRVLDLINTKEIK